MLRVENISLAAGRFRLDGISFRVLSGEYFVLRGPTGSGKSLLIKCICGIIRPDSGAIYLGDRDITRLEPRKRRIGYVPQDGCLFPHMNVAKNVTFPLRLKGMSMDNAISTMSDLLSFLGLEGLLERRIAGLSGGERQKVAVARALSNRPELLILDEPVSAIDEQNRSSICHELKRLQREMNIPTIHICHSDAETALVADRVGGISNGRMEEHDH